jgi:tRNA threonylcarbamoyl adenosine modification protein YeaZ
MALFIDNKIIDKIEDDKRYTSKLFIPHLQQLLSKNAISFAELSFCVVNCGPGPFSTLRSIIASVNGLHAATNIPLIGIDGLEATFLEFYDPAYENTVVLLNAFNNESYYLIAAHNTILRTGYKNTELLLQEIAEEFPINTPNIIDNKICSIEMIAQLGYEKYTHKEPSNKHLIPLHLKKHAVELL